jgi:hypothetical protein
MRGFLQVLVVTGILVTSATAWAQGTISVNRPLGTDFSVTTGIGSSATVTTHAPLPGPPLSGKPPVTGLYQSLPEEPEQEAKVSNDTPRWSDRSATAIVSEGPNAIARDRVESPHDAAFDENNVFNEKK